MRVLVLFGVLVSSALAGCLGVDDPAGLGAGAETTATTVQCIDGVCNFVATFEEERRGNEVSVAVNPLDPLNIIATAKDYTPEYAGDCVYAAVYVTHDGGLTWTNRNLPGSPWKRLNDPTEPLTVFSPYWCATDPVVAFGPDGTAYWTVMPYQCDAASGSKTGRGVLPQGGFNDWLFTCSAMFVLASDDGGDTWPRVREIAVGPRLEHDKQWIAAAPDGDTVLLCWDRGPATSEAADLGAPLDGYGVYCSVSADRGDTWTEQTFATDAGVYPWVDYGPDGTAWMALVTGFFEGDVIVGSSKDGGRTWGEFVKVGKFENAEGRNEYGWPALANSQFRIVPTPSLAVDRSDGPHAGCVYVTYFDHARGNGDVLFTMSMDGKTWSAPTRVHDDNGTHDQFYPAIGVGPDGTVDVTWWDRRDDPDNTLFHVYHTFSRDGGATWAPNLRVTDTPSDEKHSRHQNGMIFLGDYRDVDVTAAGATTVWVDTRHGKADVTVATIVR